MRFFSYALAHQNRTIAIASDFRVDGAKSPEIPQKEGVWGSEIAARNRKSLATFHRTLKSQCGIAFSCFGNRAISGVRDGHRNRKSQKSLRFRCAKSYAVQRKGHFQGNAWEESHVARGRKSGPHNWRAFGPQGGDHEKIMSKNLSGVDTIGSEKST